MDKDFSGIQDKKQVVFYMDYIEMIIEMFEKRGLDSSKLVEELKELRNKYQEL